VLYYDYDLLESYLTALNALLLLLLLLLLLCLFLSPVERYYSSSTLRGAYYKLRTHVWHLHYVLAVYKGEFDHVLL
jgi:hypothetical protein